MHETTKLSYTGLLFVLLASECSKKRAISNKQSELIMCGIVGIINKRDQNLDVKLSNMVATLRHRGPDSEEFGYQRIRNGSWPQ